NELNSIRINYENQLASICGTFAGDDGVIYPAIPLYADMSEPTRVLSEVYGSPCGLVKNGEIFEALNQVSTVKLDYQSLVVAQQTILDEVQIENDRVQAYCGVIVDLKNYKIQGMKDIESAEDVIRGLQYGIDHTRRLVDIASQALIITGSDILTMAAKSVAAGVWAGVAVVAECGVAVMEDQIERQLDDINDYQQAIVEHDMLAECDLAKIDSLAVIKEKLLGLKKLEVEALKIQQRIGLAFSKVQELRNKAKRVSDEMTVAEQQVIDVAAAQNDPNVRIYKNDSIITADRTFESALESAYQATKVFEYYTSQSYAHLGDLFLVRTVAFGDYNLEAYLAGLEDAYYGFEEKYGNPDLRVAIVSLRDDVLKIPYLDEKGQALSRDERIALFRERLADPSFIDENGYWAYPFATSLEQLSPLTRNHKIDHLEAELQGSATGDEVARVYFRQKGTGVVYGVEGDKIYFSFPEFTAVVNPFLNGEKPFEETVYESRRFKDRPFANTRWELVFNQRDEQVNMDVDLNSLSDIRLYAYYTDFTGL
ncbi:MAG: hypothetical protein PHU25_20900, partial [Deltaproteobacteria bacterium]|nr:hypothetical protein [Deltaproteobacteria bacterium]